MASNLKEIKKLIDEIKEIIPTFDTDERKEIKKNNKLIKEYNEELTNILLVLKKVINQLYLNKKPVYNDEISKYDSSIIKSIKDIEEASNLSYLRKFELDKILFNIKSSNNLDIINENLQLFINKFKLIDVELTAKDFMFSIPLYNYMELYFNSKNNNYVLKEKFDKVYWDCPDIVFHIYFACKILLSKYDNKWHIYEKNLIKDIDYNKIILKHKNIISKKNSYLIGNEGYIYNQFCDGVFSIDNFVLNNTYFMGIISKYIGNDQYNNFSESEKKHFFEFLQSIYDDLIEYKFVSKYNFIIDITKDIYNNKSSLSNNYKNYLKNEKKLSKKLEMINNNLFRILPKLEKNKRLENKFNKLLSNSDEIISKIIENDKMVDEYSIQDEIFNNLNDTSVYLDVYNLWLNNYVYLNSKLKENSCDYNDYINFIFNINKDITDSIVFLSDINIEEKITKKCDLFGIKIDVINLNELEEDFKYLLTYNGFHTNKINIEMFQLLLKIKKKLQ